MSFFLRVLPFWCVLATHRMPYALQAPKTLGLYSEQREPTYVNEPIFLSHVGMVSELYCGGG